MGTVKSILIGVGLNGLSLYLLTRVLPEIVYSGGIKFFVIGGIVIGVLNLIVKPLLKIVSLPIVFLTGGLFLIVINAAILGLLVWVIGVAEFRDVTLNFPNLGTYAIGGLVFGLINWGERLIIKTD